jgi:hypothetical protein
MATSRDHSDLVGALRLALSGEAATQGMRPWGEDYSRHAAHLAKVIVRNADAIVVAASGKPADNPTPAITRTPEEIEKRAYELLEVLLEHRMSIWSAVRRGDLRRAANPGSIGEMLGDWRYRSVLVDVLPEVILDMREWRQKVRATSRRPPGPKKGGRCDVAAFFRDVLRDIRIPVTAAASGYFARVLREVYIHVGFRRADVARDVRAAVAELPAPERTLARHPRTGTNSVH